LKLDLHIHSNHSIDCISTTKDIYRAVKARRLDAFSITDHDTLKGTWSMKKYLKENKLQEKIIFIPGMEIKSNIGDVICLFIQDRIKTKQISEIIDEVRGQDGMIVLAHPFKSHSFKKKDNVLERFDGIESFNARIEKELNKKAEKLADKLKKPKIGVSDAHWAENIGNGYTEIKGSSLGLDEIKRAMKKGRLKPNGKYTNKYYWHKSNVVRIWKKKEYHRLPVGIWGYTRSRMTGKG